jgi:hypothetical protein
MFRDCYSLIASATPRLLGAPNSSLRDPPSSLERQRTRIMRAILLRQATSSTVIFTKLSNSRCPDSARAISANQTQHYDERNNPSRRPEQVVRCRKTDSRYLTWDISPCVHCSLRLRCTPCPTPPCAEPTRATYHWTTRASLLRPEASVYTETTWVSL